MTYDDNFEMPKGTVPAAYTKLLLEVLRGDQQLFVRQDEIEQSWRIK